MDRGKKQNINGISGMGDKGREKQGLGGNKTATALMINHREEGQGEQRAQRTRGLQRESRERSEHGSAGKRRVFWVALSE